MSKITIWTDGSCYPNPGPGGWGIYGKSGDSEIARFGGVARTTNNRMELSAVISAMMALQPGIGATIISDSRYVVDGSSSVTNWARYGWSTSTGKPVSNRDLWEIFAKVRNRAKYEIEWTKGHAGTRGNEIADDLAGRGRATHGNKDLARASVGGPTVALIVGTGTLPKAPKKVRAFLDSYLDLVRPTAAVYFAHLLASGSPRGAWDVSQYEPETAFISGVVDDQVVAPVRIAVDRDGYGRDDLFASCWPDSIVALPGADVRDVAAKYGKGSIVYAEEFM